MELKLQALSKGILIESTTLWTDSKTVLHWINFPNRRNRIFIANHLKFILNSISQNNWGCVPSKNNPAEHRKVVTKRATWQLILDGSKDQSSIDNLYQVGPLKEKYSLRQMF